MKKLLAGSLASSLLLFLSTQVGAADEMADVEIRTEKVAPGVAVLFGQGGNIGVAYGDDGVLLIDDQFAPLTEKIQAAVAGLAKSPVRFVLNTHWHFDHTGGNENFGHAGAVIVAHDAVRERMRAGQEMKAFDRTIPPAPKEALPVVTFADGVTFHWNGDTLHVEHVDDAHTDGDAIVRFEKANVLHMGDIFFNQMYPFIDAGSGGSIEGMIAAADRGIELADDKTVVIPGHGAVTDVEGLRAYRNVLQTIRSRIRAALDEGKTVDEIVASKPTADFDAKWGQGVLTPDQFVKIVASSM